MAALNAKLLVGGAFATQIFGEREVVGGQGWYHSKNDGGLGFL